MVSYRDWRDKFLSPSIGITDGVSQVELPGCVWTDSQETRRFTLETQKRTTAKMSLFITAWARIFSFLLHLLLSPGQWLGVISNVFISIFKFEKGVWNKDQAEGPAGGAWIQKTWPKWALTRYVNFAFAFKGLWWMNSQKSRHKVFQSLKSKNIF